MRYGLLLLAVLLLSGCIHSDDFSASTNEYAVATTEPARPMLPIPASLPSTQIYASATATGWLWIMVIDRGSACIDGAVIEITSGQGKGFSATLRDNCDVWEWEGGYFLYGLIPGQPLTIRTTAPGYQDNEKTFLPSSAEYPQVTLIELSPAE